MNEVLNKYIEAIVFNRPFLCDENTDWNAIYQEMKEQSIYALPYGWLEAHPIPDARLMQRWTETALAGVAYYYNLLEVQKAMGGLLEQAGIPYVILKGSAAGMYYPNPELRCYGDIDVLVLPEDFPRALDLLRDNGFTYDEDDGRHAELSYEGISIELHHFFTEKHLDGIGDDLDQYIFQMVPKAVYRRFRDLDGGFYSLPELENGLVLLQHVKQHIKSGLGLRQIIDWMLYVDAVLTDEFWNEKFAQKAEEFRMKDLAVTVTRMCQIYLGLSDEITWCKDADVWACQQLMDLVYSTGNFGSKTGNSTRRVMQVLTTQNIFRRLQERGLNHWKAAQRYRVLRPFAWVYQLGRYVVLGFSREAPIRSLIRDLHNTRDRKKLFDKLGC